MIDISIIHPSRSRPEQAKETYNKWMSKSQVPSRIEYVLALDHDDPDRLSYVDWPNMVVGPHKTAIEAINNAAPHTKGRIIIVVSDDFDCPIKWDEHLLSAIGDNEDFVLKTQDGLQPFIVTLPIMDRFYYNSKGYVYYPGYQHMFCDTEMTAVAYMEGKLLTSELMFPHNHYTTGRNRRDEISIKNDATWIQGQTLYNQRKSVNFGIANPVNPYPEHAL